MTPRPSSPMSAERSPLSFWGMPAVEIHSAILHAIRGPPVPLSPFSRSGTSTTES
jgi:hypothetical protein